MDWIQAVGLLALLLFYGSYFTKQLHLRRQGISTNLLGRGTKPMRTYVIEVLLKTLTYVHAGVQLASLFFLQSEYGPLTSPTVRSIGLGLSFAGIGVFIMAMVTMKTSWRAGVDASQQTKLIRGGIYRYSRNPAFVGFDLFYLGFALAFFNPVTLIFLVLCAGTLHLQILEEEKFLPTLFSQEYTDYMRSTARYLGMRKS
ncbi:isoprenylcysteine carboxylmethyltransferase family protein [Gorillibacterium sp. CAU 1737]|uniref:methyltransferase family protein n=1 Tax=Gorillibacterium sp. CAU 1737 TaxID=3140362 RepID=UPI003260F0C8